jgi:glycosyltransferase involved in cell wall biosynthesis
MRIVAMLQTYNEEMSIAACIEHLHAQGVDVYLIDEGSSDTTVEIAERYLGHGVIDIELLPATDRFCLREQCRRQEALADRLDADWLIHHDADEIRVAPRRRQSLAQALTEIDEAGYNAVNFLEFTFVPTRESPDHDRPGYQRTMRSYYAFVPFFPARLNAWKRQNQPVELEWSGGHKVRFAGLSMAPTVLYMRHYLFRSLEHAARKFTVRPYDADEVAGGWYGFRPRVRAKRLELPAERDLLYYVADDLLDATSARTTHLLDELFPRQKPGARQPA